MKAKGQGAFSDCAIFSTLHAEPTKGSHMCVREEHAQEVPVEQLGISEST